MIVARLVNHGLVHVRVEVGAERVDQRDAALAQQVEHLLVDQLDAACDCLGVTAGRRLQRTLEVVDDWQQLEQHVGGCVLRQLAALALDPLAVVVEVRDRAEELLLQRVAFLLQRRQGLVGRRRSRTGGLRLFSRGLAVGHRVY